MTKHFLLRAGRIALLALALGAFAYACKSPGSAKRVRTKEQEQQVTDNVLTAVPAIGKTINANYDDKITLLGYDIDKMTVAKGDKVDLTLYFRADQELKGDWKIFVHFESPGKRRQPFDHYAINDLYPTSEWKKGQIIRDKINIQVPGDWPDGPTQIIIGIFDWAAWDKAKQDRRLAVKNKQESGAMPDDRLLLTTIQIGQGGGTPAPSGATGEARPPVAPEGPASYGVMRAAGAIAIDGKLDEASWTGAASTAMFRQPDARSLSASYATSAKLLWDDDNLYVAFTTRDDQIANTHADRDSELWEGDVVEIFLDPSGEGKGYFELQFAPNGAKFDAKFEGHRDPEWKDAARWNIDAKSAVQVEGSVNADDAKADRSWTVEVAIPWKGLGLAGAPKAPATWTANFYRIDSKGTHNVEFMGAWAPVGGDFHDLSKAGKLNFLDAKVAAPAADAIKMPAIKIGEPIKPVELKPATSALDKALEHKKPKDNKGEDKKAPEKAPAKATEKAGSDKK